jgi:Circularly permutated YpsA SLOG family
MPYPSKIISGGQRGADQAGLHAALELGIETGGTAPQGWRVQLPDESDGQDPWLEYFGLIQHKSSEYRPRTIQNVKDADATVWFGYTGSGGGKLTLDTAQALEKPYIVNPEPDELRAFCEQNQVAVLNVAGNRLSYYNPNIFSHTHKLIKSAFGRDEFGLALNPCLAEYGSIDLAKLAYPEMNQRGGLLVDFLPKDEHVKRAFDLKQFGKVSKFVPRFGQQRLLHAPLPNDFL